MKHVGLPRVGLEGEIVMGPALLSNTCIALGNIFLFSGFFINDLFMWLPREA